MGANTDVTDLVEEYRQTIREAGIPQAPAPTEQIDTIQCPVNIRRASLLLKTKPLSLSCLIDNNTETMLKVQLKRKEKTIADKSIKIEKTGIEHHIEIALASIDFNDNTN